MGKAVVRAASYLLVHAPDMIINNGTTCSVEKMTNPDSEFLKKVPESIRSFEEVVNYAPNQVYIGNMTPDELAELSQPFCNEEVKGDKDGKYGAIVEEDIFMAAIKLADAFELVKLTDEFAEQIGERLADHPLFNEEEIAKVQAHPSSEEVKKLIEEQDAETLSVDGEVVGCVKRAHDVDVNLSAHIMLENLVAKASGILSAKELLLKYNIDADDIDYVIECSEEACGDMNQRGGGNFAKAIAEGAHLNNATGADIRGFCAAPVHAMINAASLVAAGTFKNVLVVAGGSTAKLGMNARDHIAKGFPVLEDVVGGFAVLVSQDDGVHPYVNLEYIGRHKVGTGSSPQAVMTSLISEPLDRHGLAITDVDKYSVEMQNPDITKPAGAGDVPASNYKMIGALAVKSGVIERKELATFAQTYGMPGFAPTQGHIPSGVPYLGFAIDELTEGDKNRVMIVGKGSLFLGRMTNLFDGVSFLVERNEGVEEEREATTDVAILKEMLAKAMEKVAEELAE